MLLLSTINFNEAVWILNDIGLEFVSVSGHYDHHEPDRFTSAAGCNAAFKESRYLEIELSYVAFFMCSIVYDLLLYVINSVFVVQNAILNNGLISQWTQIARITASKSNATSLPLAWREI